MTAQKIPAHDYATAVQWVKQHATPGMMVLQIAHDDFCPAIHSHRDADCCAPCRPDFYLIRPPTAACAGRLN